MLAAIATAYLLFTTPIDTTLNGFIRSKDGSTETYYRKGKKNGIFKSYYRKTGTLEALGFYENDTPAGTWYYFDADSRISMIEEKRGLNKDKKINIEGKLHQPKYQSYLKEYDPKTGALKGEGLVLYFDDIEIDYYKYGTWKEYR
ncbi:hypothetical protein [Chitinophaga varians]|uniref:hypothetical protein n=1 Tax=Chitinophaga varians TaxID=2202339 RepID=UPI00165F1613|nr:hypothetical protein [Chitinophaga varians]MBC9911296.1 hypothetical protein [Chitinophaga varians]